MAFKVFVFACVLAVAKAGVIASVGHYAAPQVHYAPQVQHYAAPQVQHYAAPQVAHYAAPQVHYSAPQVQKVHYAQEEQYAPAEYNFEYSVHDEHTGDIKSQKEVRHGDAVQGSYSLIEADGSRRVVEYTADDHNGFNAVVHKEPGQHSVAVKKIIAAPVYAHAAPAYAHAAPAYTQVSHAAPVYAHAAPAYTQVSHAAPVYAHAAPAYAQVAHVAPVHQTYAHVTPVHQAYAAPAQSYYHH